jgi:hypothetical protein
MTRNLLHSSRYAGQAFDVLATVSQDTNRKLHVVAEELTRTGTLDR